MSQLLTAEQLAARWQVPKSHVYRLTRTGQVPAVKLGKYYRYAPAAIEAFEAGETPAPPILADTPRSRAA